MGKRLILDANAVIDYTGNRLNQPAAEAMDILVNEGLHVSAIVKIEVVGFNGKDAEMDRLKRFLSLAFIFYVDDAIADKTIELRKVYRKLKLGDAIIVATAIVNDLILVSRNTKDFEGIVGLNCINPHELK
jgi:predicted nucleic acid-binding protein